MSLVTTAPNVAQRSVSAANTATSITLPATEGKQHRLTFLAATYHAGSGVPSVAAPGVLTVADGATTVLDLSITGPGTTIVPLPEGGIVGSMNTAMTITLGAGGTASIGKLSIASTT